MVDTLSPRARAAAEHVTALEAELARLRADVAPTLERIATLERSLEAVELAARPKQAALLDIGAPAAPLREPTSMGEQLLRRARHVGALSGTEEGPYRFTITRDAVSRGELKCAHALASGARPLIVEVSRTTTEVCYRLTLDGETVARALPIIVAGEAST